MWLSAPLQVRGESTSDTTTRAEPLQDHQHREHPVGSPGIVLPLLIEQFASAGEGPSLRDATGRAWISFVAWALASSLTASAGQCTSEDGRLAQVASLVWIQDVTACAAGIVSFMSA